MVLVTSVLNQMIMHVHGMWLFWMILFKNYIIIIFIHFNLGVALCPIHLIKHCVKGQNCLGIFIQCSTFIIQCHCNHIFNKKGGYNSFPIGVFSIFHLVSHIKIGHGWAVYLQLQQLLSAYVNFENNATWVEAEFGIGICGTTIEHLVYNLHGLLYTLSLRFPQ